MAPDQQPTMSDKTSRSSLESVDEKQANTPSTRLSQEDGPTDEEAQVPRRVPSRGLMPDTAEGAALENTMSYQSVPATPSIPNGGTVAWLQVAAGFFMFFNSW